MDIELMDVAEAEAVRSRVQQFLRDADPRFNCVTVEADETAVRLFGHVNSFYIRSLVLETTMRTAGRARVIDDNLMVAPR